MKNLLAVVLAAVLLLVAMNACDFFESKFSRKINPEAIVVIGKIQIDSFNYNSRKIVDEDKLKVTKAVEKISAQEEHLSFEDVYSRIKELNYYDLPPLYWDQLDDNQKHHSFEVWEAYMKDLMRQCAGNEIVKFTQEEIVKCVELKKRGIEEKRKLLFN